MSTAIAYRSYAKINLYLDITGRRRDGYHNIETVFHSVSLADSLTFTELSRGIDIECSTPELGANPTNLAYRAAALLQERTGCRRGVHIYLNKRIPLAAGLAGGSGNAAAALAAINQLWELRLSEAQLCMLGRELGADVPYCIIGGAQGARLRGDDLFPLPPLDRTWLVLVHPPMPVSTAGVYSHPNLGRSVEQPFAGRTPAFRKALRALQRRDFASAVYNRMESAVLHNHPQLRAIKEALLTEGCVAAAMSGSGPTMFGICEDDRHARKVAERLGEHRTSVVRTVDVGIERIQ